MCTLRLVLGDQLNEQHSWFLKPDPQHVYVLMEVRQETDYVRHHIQKVSAFFLAMRHFCQRQKVRGHRIHYLALDDPRNLQSIPENLEWLLQEYQATAFHYQLPDEYRLDQQMAQWCRTLHIPWQVFDTEHFFTSRAELSQFFAGRKTYLMESFYRHMRQKHGILMEGNSPAGGQWNFDAENRKPFPSGFVPPPRDGHAHDVRQLVELIQAQVVSTIGEPVINSRWPASREEALADVQEFCQHWLPYFGQYQDAMHTAAPFGFHSLISFALNVKLISPREVVEAAVSAWQAWPDVIPLAAVEGFVRQIIGWREYMRGVYWARMPEYALRNALDHQRPLPSWYWTGNTRMNCLRHAIGQSLRHAYAHHIQRLMVTGNFALLNLTHPDEVDQWYLGIYVDALEWVEITNTRGMSQYADGGLVGSKPYVASANYIRKMSNYCKSCHYAADQKTGERACPFNSLYWHFFHVHRNLLEHNPRIGMAYRNWDKMDPEQQKALLQQASEYLEKVEEL